MPTGLIIIAVVFLLYAIANVVAYTASSLPEQIQYIQKQLNILRYDVEKAKEQIDDLYAEEELDDFDEYLSEIEDIFYHIFDEFSMEKYYQLQGEWQLIQKEIIKDFKNDAWKKVSRTLHNKHQDQVKEENGIGELCLISYAELSQKLDEVLKEDIGFSELEEQAKGMEYSNDWNCDALMQTFVKITKNFLMSLEKIMQEVYEKYSSEETDEAEDIFNDLQQIETLLANMEEQDIPKQQMYSKFAALHFVGSKKLDSFPHKFSYVLLAVVFFLGVIGVFVGGSTGWLLIAIPFVYYIIKQSNAIYLINSTAKDTSEVLPTIKLYSKHVVRIALLMVICCYLFSSDIYHYFGIQSAPIFILLCTPLLLIVIEFLLHNTFIRPKFKHINQPQHN